jgi:sulfoquinovosidase
MRRMRELAFAVVLALGLVLPAASGQAAVSVGARRIVLSGPWGSAVIDRARFRLAIAAPSGRAVLSEVANAAAAPSALPPTQDPLAPGTDAQRSGALYAPLTFLVGTQTITQYPGGVWGGNLLSGVRSGIQYRAGRVLSVHRTRRGIALTVATNDPGRTLEVTLASQSPAAVHITVQPRPATGVVTMSDAFTSTRREAFYGFGGRHNALDQHGHALSSFVQEENLPGLGSRGSPQGVLFPNGPAAAYYPQAEFVSSRGYGFLLAQPQLAWFRLDSDRPQAWSVAASGASLSYVVAPGRPGQAIGALTRLSGRQPAPPAWALGPMLDRLVKNTGETEAGYEAELEQDIANIDRYHLPVTAYRIEGWGFPDRGNDGVALHRFVTPEVQARVIAELRARHIHPLAYLRPWITPGSAPDRAGLTVRTSAGASYLTSGTQNQPIALLDFTNPAAVRFWRRQVDRVLALGFDGFMADFGEEILADMHFADGQTGAAMHNRYLVLYMRATREAITAFERAHPERHVWFFNRAGYSGLPGSAAYEGGNFPGDEATDWGQGSGLASLTDDMLGRAVGGAYGYATDIGGYYDYTTPPTTKELFLRWAEWAALSPIFRLHGSGRSGTHTPWSYDRQTVAAYRALSRLHARAAPLILRLWREADRTGIPPTRPLWLAFPGDARAAAQQQEWMLGPDVLVAPVVTQGARGRRVYFPAGCWRDPQTGRVQRGARFAFVAAPLTRLPYFFRCGHRPF